MNFVAKLKNIYLSVTDSKAESRALLRLIGNHAAYDAKVLDVGCGFGRILDCLLSGGYRNIKGVEINPETVRANQLRGLDCVTVDEFNRTEDKFDVILMSQIIEHFLPEALRDFIDAYLDRLVPGGILVIATPLLTEYFYDDFDHIKPYSPTSILQVFGERKAQIQYYSRNKVRLNDLIYRRSHFRPSFFRGIYLKGLPYYLLKGVTFLSAIAYHLSFGFIGKKDGWIGVFQKTQAH